jgi:pilus assembly protein TadC
MGAEENFERVLLTGKISLIVALLALCFVNGNNSYVSKNPKKFMGDCVVSGLSGAVAFSIIAYMRDKTYLLPGLAISSFLLLFVFNVLCEFSGFNSNTSQMTDQEKKELKFGKIPIAVCMFVGLGLLTYFAYTANVPLEGSNLLAEAAVFGILSGLAQAFISATHGGGVAMSAGVGVAMTLFFALLHVAMQKGGFYENMVFSDAPPCIS